MGRLPKWIFYHIGALAFGLFVFLEVVMPWDIFKEGDEWCVHKINADGERGDLVACHDTKEEAWTHLSALYANEPDAATDKSMDLVRINWLIQSHSAAGLKHSAMGESAATWLSLAARKTAIYRANTSHRKPSLRWTGTTNDRRFTTTASMESSRPNASA